MKCWPYLQRGRWDSLSHVQGGKCALNASGAPWQKIHGQRCIQNAQLKSTSRDWGPHQQASEAAPCLGIVFFFFFPFLARRKTSVSYLNGTLYWRSPELVSSLFNFRKWCHNALNNSAGWFIFPWTCCPKHSSSLAVFPINCKLECSSYFIMILRGGGGRLGVGRGVISEVAEVQS